MHHIAYASRAVRSKISANLKTLCQESATYNHRVGITGLLVFDGVRYLQLIEGEYAAIRQLMDKIARDNRHEKIVYMFDEPIAERAFEQWDMACVGFRYISSSSQLLSEVKEKVRNVNDIHIKAFFIGFAALAK